MDRLELVIAVSDVLLNVYGKKKQRENKLTEKFGSKDADEIQKEVNTVVSQKTEAKYMAVACIDEHYGKGKERRKKLGKWYTKVQDRIDYIYSMRGRSLTSVANLVIGGQFDKGSVRVLLLKFCGYDPVAVQAEVDRILTEKSKARFCVYPVWFFQDKPSAYGDCTAVLQFADDGTVAYCVLIDTAMSSVSPTVIRKLKALGIKKIDAVVISHAHADHYGGLSNILKAFPVGRLYLPDCTGLDRYQKSFGNAIRSQAKKVANHVYLKQGSAFTVGDIKCRCIYQAPASKLSDHDDHYFVNNQSTVLRFDLGGIIYHTAGDLQNEGNNLLISAVPALGCDIYKCQWHGDANACNEAICKATHPPYAFSNYHNSPTRAGRDKTRARLTAVGAKFFSNYVYGDIYFLIQDGKINVRTSR